LEIKRQPSSWTNRLSANSRGFLLASTGTVLIATNYISVKYALSGMNAETFAWLWTLSAAVYAFIYIQLTGQGPSLNIGRDQVRIMAAIGVLNGLNAYLTWKGLSYIAPALSSFIWRFLPVFSILLGVIFLKESFLPAELLPMGLMILGTFTTVATRWESVSTGVLFSFSGCVVSSLQLLLVKIAVRKVKPGVVVFYRNLLGSLVVAAIMLLTHQANLNARLPFLAVAVLGPLHGEVISFILTFKSYTYWSLSYSSLVRTLDPLLVLPLGYLAYHYIPGPREFIGGSMILVGAVAFVLLHLQSTRPGSKPVEINIL
jgi:drug/metabolite transporter (DMT)-like permease